eukprot:CAMPEP_0204492730 /NCGR_PEP_ID=MMETSP0471-20130131/80395_1 /ASSEMBLY_ACC=CAM_ASM_000602 /TAXON_ID=2969 /ORGANISM="Oxyrrhis marina" /LENGTH=86 /DNA_ID=CAMNT_0051496821 /DNA_START=311 /DNA_END=571 /DNA_ORIENTATION=+
MRSPSDEKLQLVIGCDPGPHDHKQPMLRASQMFKKQSAPPEATYRPVGSRERATVALWCATTENIGPDARSTPRLTAILPGDVPSA